MDTPPQITYLLAAGWLEPHLDPDTPPHLIQKWAGQHPCWESEYIRQKLSCQQPCWESECFRQK